MFRRIARLGCLNAGVKNPTRIPAMANDNNIGQKPAGRLIAADFFSHAVKALLIGVAASVVLGGAVILIAQSGSQDEAASINQTPAIKEAP